MFIYVAGPYSHGEKHIRDRNAAEASRAGRDLLAKGHRPFVPHTMTLDWEEDNRFTYSDFMDLALAWLERCDALLFLGPSPGANMELQRAQLLGLPVYYEIEQVPDGTADT